MLNVLAPCTDSDLTSWARERSDGTRKKLRGDGLGELMKIEIEKLSCSLRNRVTRSMKLGIAQYELYVLSELFSGCVSFKLRLHFCQVDGICND